MCGCLCIIQFAYVGCYRHYIKYIEYFDSVMCQYLRGYNELLVNKKLCFM